ncbi:MAG: penicillin-binding protein [Spirochaetia bacterium]|jgi:cell division protein FtsI (penicillin-binding protein 3)|nr:penicillin-binding protein [Spirochaetia bacterium]
MKSSTFQLRKKIFLTGTILIVLLIIIRYMSLMLFTSDEGEASALQKPVVERGPVLDRNGRILAIQTRLYSVTAWIPSIKDVDKTTSILSEVLELDKNQLIKEISSRPRFMYIKRKISNSDADKLRAYLDKGELPGIGLEPEYGRSYPEKELASHLIGYTGTDNIGLEGIEYTYNSILSPPASQSIVNNRDIYGNQVFLTIDINIQNFAHQAALEAWEKYNPDSVMLIAAEARTGDILAYVSIPEVDLNNFSASRPEERINRPVAIAFEPGSVFKIFSMASLLQLGGITDQSEFYCNGYFEINTEGTNPVKINCLGNHGTVTPESILKYSCNAGAAYASLTVSDESYYQMLKLFDFGERTGVLLPGETVGLLREDRLWSIRSKPTISFGQEISVSAMQVVKAASVFANEGVMVQPHLVSKVVGYDGKVVDKSIREPIRQVLSPETASSILKMMVKVSDADGGTGRRAAVEGITMAVKTGTAQKLDKETGKYSDKEFISSCLAVFPAENPQIIVYNVIENPKKVSYYGGVIAAPLVGDLSDKIVSYLGIPRTGDRVISHPGKITVRQKAPLTLDDKVPDFTGMSKRELLPLLKDNRVKVLITGEGWVKNQSPSPGTEVVDGLSIKLELE